MDAPKGASSYRVRIRESTSKWHSATHYLSDLGLNFGSTTSLTLTDQAKALPNMKGSGQVRDLSEAISLSSTLGNTVQTYSTQSTRQGQVDRLDTLIEQWANTSSMKSLKDQADALAGSANDWIYGCSADDVLIYKLG